MSTQDDLNAALKESGGEWTTEVNDLAKKRDAEQGQVFDVESGTYSTTGGSTTGGSTTGGSTTGGSTTSETKNSWGEYWANILKPNDELEYINGQLINTLTNEPLVPNSDGIYMHTDANGVTKQVGRANDATNDPDYVAGEKSSSSIASTAIKALVSPITLFPNLASSLVSWANNLSEEDTFTTEKYINWRGQTVDRIIYTNLSNVDGDLTGPINSGPVKQYSINFLNMPYEVRKNEDGIYVDALTLKVDKETGEPVTAKQIEDGVVAVPGYEYHRIEAETTGNNASVAELEKMEEDNSSDANDTAAVAEPVDLTMAQTIEAWAKEIGMDLENTDLAAMADDPEKWLEDNNLKLEDMVPTLNADATGTTLDATDPKYALGETDALNVEIAQAGDATVVGEVTNPGAVGYEASTNTNKMDSSFDVNAAIGTIDDDNLVDASAIETDMQGVATGTNKDGTINYSGVATNDYATQKFSTIIDTSTVSGKNLAAALGEGNYVDQKASITGQMEIISAQFVNKDGQSVIPKWAQKIARSVAGTMAYDGITGSAQTGAMATAIMEATLGVAEKEATFFQTLTTKNLDNKQEAIINKANILSRFEVANLGARQAAAVQNAQAFLEMDLSNLTNEQQAEVVNKQAKVQALFEDSKIINAQRLFTAKETNDFNKFYSELNVSIEKHNSSEMNAIKKFNAGEINDGREFNAELENNREKFYSTMQFDIDTANAKWRQEVTVKQFAADWEAITLDVKNSLDLSTEAMNQLWDRTDSLLDFIFRKEEGDANRTVTLLGSQLSAQSAQTGGSSFLETVLGLTGTLLGTKAGSNWAVQLFDKYVSDIRLKKNIKKIGTDKGINLYSWEWNAEGLRIGADRHPTRGVIAQEIQKTHPSAISRHASGYLMVNYKEISDGFH